MMVCWRCRISKEKDNFDFGKSRRLRVCRECVINPHTREYYDRLTIKCNKCLELKTGKDFDLGRKICRSCRNQKKRKGRVGERRERINRQKREWAKNNPEKIREQYGRSKVKNPELRKLKHNIASKKYYNSHKQKSIECTTAWRKNNRARANQLAMDCYHRNIEKYRKSAIIKEHNKRILKSSGGSKVKQEDIDRLYLKQNGKCVVCKISLKKGYHIDHIEPISRGGKHWTGNLQLLCRRCNLQKSSKDPIEFMQSRGFLL